MRISDLGINLREIPVWFRGEGKIQKGEGVGSEFVLGTNNKSCRCNRLMLQSELGYEGSISLIP